MSKYGCPECRHDRAKSDGGLQVQFDPDGSMQVWNGFIFQNNGYTCDKCDHEFAEPKEFITCKCGSERFTDKLIGDETVTTCDECGRERNEE